MSLIEEALKKQRAETEAAHAGSDGAPPPPPLLPPAQDNIQATAPPPAARNSRRMLWALMVAAAIVLAIAGVKVGIPYAKPGLLRLQNAAATALPARPTAAPAVTRSATSAVPADVAAPATNAPVPPPVQPPPQTRTPPMAVTSTGAPPSTVTTAAAPHAVAVPAQPAPEPAQKEPIVWPHLAVSGLMGGSQGGAGTAIINGQILNTGESIDGVKVVAVTKAGVTLLYAGETRVLKIGDTID